MSLTLARLQQLKRQAGGNAPANESPRPSGPGIDELRRHLRRRVPVESTFVRAPSHDRAVPGEEIAPGLRLLETTLPFAPSSEWIDGRFDRREPLHASQLLFFDTETTGLAGGSGTRAFMIGAADWHGGALRIRQLVLTAMSGEAAMLDAFRQWLRPEHVLVSYNGKCYDAPLLATRYRLSRMPNPLAELGHVDLLYPTRRRYRGRWENCRLATIERRALDVVREDDLPGSEAPAAWLSYLRGGSAHNLRRVLAHNDRDVATLAQLLLHLSELSVREADCPVPAEDGMAVPL
ncbi:ribonuclease H-like domain-containing protein [Lysobacter sp.]|uniref:ribonuclease H-like domain-containing protein n=1 Tax=Lysobacter sp. TaxID=72226 RepID=UPI002D5E7347|nr:ribonuclease H-like domain-containing protein [Lysobacter sp.]HZX76218.1 ribonuclease H-like domain-containing protein [Lysobacter sp.]